MSVNHIEGLHQDGAVDAIITFEINGEIAHDYVTIPFTGVRPVQAELDAAAIQLTGCKTARVTSYVIIDLGYGEDQYTCPNAAHVKPINKPTTPVNNYYEVQLTTKLDILNVVVAKTKQIRLNQTTRTGQTFSPNQ